MPGGNAAGSSRSTCPRSSAARPWTFAADDDRLTVAPAWGEPGVELSVVRETGASGACDLSGPADLLAACFLVRGYLDLDMLLAEGDGPYDAFIPPSYQNGWDLFDEAFPRPC